MSIAEDQALFHRYREGDPTLEQHAKVGDVLYRSGDYAGSTTKMIVTEYDLPFVNTWWHRLYFENYEDAEAVTREEHAAYSDWQSRLASGTAY